MQSPARLGRRRLRLRLATVSVALVAALATVAATASASSTGARATTLTGAGSTFVFPLVSQWAPAVDGSLGINLNYNAIGSGGGIAAITNRTVDFGASDAPLSRDQFSACKGCVQIPWALSATSVFYNVPGVRSLLKVTGPVLADIYLGRITKWNDRRLRRLNAGVSLPDLKITVVYRSDNSGTTYNFTDYLSRVSPQWKSKVGRGVNASWPTGLGGRGSSGVSGVVTRTQGAVGYADVAYTLKNKLPYFRVRNRFGTFATPGLRGIRSAALSDRTVGRNNQMSIVNPPQAKKYANAYPICTYTYVILPLRSQKAAELRRFVNWALTKGQTYGPRLLFVPVPKHVLAASQRTLRRLHA